MPVPQDAQPDPKRIVEFLAKDSPLPANVVAKIYEDECAGLAKSARVTLYLHIFAIRNVQEILRAQGASRPELAAA